MNIAYLGNTNLFDNEIDLADSEAREALTIVIIQLQRPFFSSATVLSCQPRAYKFDGCLFPEDSRLYLPALKMELKAEGPFKSERQRCRAAGSAEGAVTGAKIDVLTQGSLYLRGTYAKQWAYEAL